MFYEFCLQTSRHASSVYHSTNYAAIIEIRTHYTRDQMFRFSTPNLIINHVDIDSVACYMNKSLVSFKVVKSKTKVIALRAVL